MKKNSLLAFVVIFFVCQGLLFANDYPGSKTNVAYVQPNSGNPFYSYGVFGIDIGKKYDSVPHETETDRTKFAFDLTGIPSNATITSVSLSYTIYNPGNWSYKFKITQINNYSSPQDIWQNIGSATALFSNIFYGSGSNSSGTLTSLVNSNKGGTLYLGALSQNESSLDSWANLNLTLSVTFTVSVSITADNNFTVSGGTHGSIKVDGNTYTAPYTFSRNTGTNVTLQAVSPQTDNQSYQEIWNTSSCDQSKWTKDGLFKSSSQAYALTAVLDDNAKTYLANFHQNRVTTSGALSANETWVSSVSLSGNVTVPSGITLNITTCATVNFNGYYIVSTGGTINPGNITCTYLLQSGVLKGLFSTIQSAVNYSSSGQTVGLQARTHNESFTLSSKSGVTITGAGITSTTINGSVNFSSSQNCTMTNLTVANNVSLSWGSNYNYLSNLKVLGNIQPSYGSYSDIRYVDLTSSSNIGISAGYSNAYFENCPIKNKSVEGISATGMTMTVAFSILCNNGPSGNRLDVLSSCGSPDIYLHSCFFSNITEGSTVSGSYIHWDYWGYCGSPKEVATIENTSSYQIKELPSVLAGLSEEKKLSGEGDYDNVIVNYRTIFDKIRKENIGKMIDFKQYEKELTGIISQFKDIMKKYPGSISSVQSLQEVISCYRLLQDQQSAKQTIKNLLADKYYGEVFSHIKFLSISLLIDDQNYDGALSLCDELLSEIPNTSEAACLLHSKGLIFETLKNDKTNAEKMYNQLIDRYPKSMYANLVAESLGKEMIPQKSETLQKIDKYELSNYPNPFNPSTVISYQLPEPGHVSLMVYDMLGRRVASLIDGMKEAGYYSVTFDGSRLSSGIYFTRMVVQSQEGSPIVQVKKMQLMK